MLQGDTYLWVNLFNGVLASSYAEFNLLALFQGKEEDEVCTFLPLGDADYLASELLDNLLGDVQSQSDSLRVKLFCSIQEAKELEQFLLVFIFDSNS